MSISFIGLENLVRSTPVSRRINAGCEEVKPQARLEQSDIHARTFNIFINIHTYLQSVAVVVFVVVVVVVVVLVLVLVVVVVVVDVVVVVVVVRTLRCNFQT